MNPELLRKLALAFAGAPNLAGALERVVALLAETEGAERAVFYGKAKGSKQLGIIASFGSDTAKAPKTVPVGEGPFGSAVLEPLATWADWEGRTWACAPVMAGSELVGLLALARSGPEENSVLTDLETLAGFMVPAMALREAGVAERDLWTAQAAAYRGELDRLSGSAEMLGDSEVVYKLKEMVSQVAPSAITVLITGESGTGKELVATLLHTLSDRREGPLVKVSCAALPENLAESELFGHARGAFTGALDRKPGYFSRAHGGTIFLDEVGELSQAIQAKLLRVLQDGRFEEVGGTAPLRSDVRVVAATNRDLSSEVKAGRFRQDLFFRLSAFPLRVPPLRARREDIPVLATHFLKAFAAADKRKAQEFTPEALKIMEAHEWPGNIRELQSVVHRSVLLCPGEKVGPSHLPLDPEGISAQPAPVVDSDTLAGAIAQMEMNLIRRALQSAGGVRALAAKRLDTTLRILNYKIRKYGLEPSRPAPGEPQSRPQSR